MKFPEFEITGWFYRKRGFRFRGYLDIRHRSCLDKLPEMMLVMMNPGASLPLQDDEAYDRVVRVKPDRTQYQIMSLMQQTGINSARVLNLSDLCTTQSKDLYAFIQSAAADACRHSIFDSRRSEDFKRWFVDEVPVVYAWGVAAALEPLATLAMQRLAISNPLGMQKPGCETAWYHPLPKNIHNQREWLKVLTGQIINSR